MDGGLIAVLIILVSLAIAAGVIGLIYLAFQKQAKENYLTQRQLTDRELLRLFAAQPDGILTAERIAYQTELTKKQAISRLRYLNMQGMLLVHHNSRLKGHYSLKEPLDDRSLTGISKDPFLTVEDLLLLFQHYDYKLNYQKICMSTGLPVSVIKEELNYFIKQKIITKVQRTDVSGMYTSILFLLEEPYRSNTSKFLEREKEINLELEKIYIKEIRKT